MTWTREDYNRAHKEWGQRNPEKLRAKWRKAHARKRDTRNAKRRKRGVVTRQERKRIALTHYGRGRAACVNCGVADLDVLTLDHIANDGAFLRRAGQGTGEKLYAALIKAGFPAGYQTLCANCNLKKKIAAADCCQGGLVEVA